MAYDKCRKRWPRGRDTVYQCTRKAGHVEDGDREHVDSKSMPIGRWTEPEADD